ncbi:MAG: DUF6273 domain-containing protein [Coriobacteriales bacterium]|jgi:hypothetical protein|nr:DUF6273 domain-containing protein [Coriobacteriales bacterium]
MAMQKLQCELCGGRLIKRESGEFECDSCGMAYEKEVIQQMLVTLDAPVQIEGMANAASLLDRAFILCEDGDFDGAAQGFARVLEAEPRNAQAYVGSLMASLKLRQESQLGTIKELPSSYQWFERARQFADSDYRTVLDGYENLVNEKYRPRIKFAQNLTQLQTGQHIAFGAQAWRVLHVEGKRALIITENLIDIRRFDASSNKWAVSELRCWLNGEWYGKTFIPEEQRVIATTELEASEDKVFLLSIDEAKQYFSSDSDRIAKTSDDDAEFWWWLRSPGRGSYVAAFVDEDGIVFADGSEVDFSLNGVRPALWLNLES